MISTIVTPVLLASKGKLGKGFSQSRSNHAGLTLSSALKAGMGKLGEGPIPTER